MAMTPSGPMSGGCRKEGVATSCLVQAYLMSFPNPTFDPIAKPAVFQKRLQELESGSGDRVLSTTDKRRYGELVPISPAYRDRDARLEVMDTQGPATAARYSLRWESVLKV